MKTEEITHSKITVGFVVQSYKGANCIHQEFVAGDPVEYEDKEGNPIEIDTTKEVYQPFNMVQPDYDYYILKLEGLVEPVIIGPFDSEKERDERIEEYREDPAFGRDSFTEIKISKGSEFDTL